MAEKTIEKIIQEARTLSDKGEHARALDVLGTILRGCYIHRSPFDMRNIPPADLIVCKPRISNLVGGIYQKMGNLDEAMDYYRMAVSEAESIENSYPEMFSANKMKIQREKTKAYANIAGVLALKKEGKTKKYIKGS